MKPAVQAAGGPAACHRAPRDLPRRDGVADAPDHGRRSVAGDDRRHPRPVARQEGRWRNRRGGQVMRENCRRRFRFRTTATSSTSSAPAATARTPSTSPPPIFVRVPRQAPRSPSTAAQVSSSSGSADVPEALWAPTSTSRRSRSPVHRGDRHRFHVRPEPPQAMKHVAPVRRGWACAPSSTSWAR